MARRPALIASLVYAAAGSLWVLATDRLAERLGETAVWASHDLLQTVKGIAYVVVTALLVYALVRRATVTSVERARELEAAVDERTRDLSLARREADDLFENAPCGYHTLDAEGRIERINATELAWVGCARDELVGRPMTELLTPGSRKVYERSFPGVVEGTASLNVEVTLIRRNGDFLPVLVSATAERADDGAFLRSRSIVLDRTELFEAQRRIERLNRLLQTHNTELEIRNRDLMSFAYTISHDLRAPLRAVNGFAAIVRRRYCDSLPEEAARYLDNIVAASERMDRQIEDLLRYARLAGEVIMRPLPLLPIVQRIRDERRALLTEVGGSIALPEADAEITADRMLLSRVLENLVDNAIRYRSPDRKVLVRVTYQREADFVEISVTDNGVGIAPEHHERVFTLFQRLQHDDHTGTGVGLALARRAAEAMHGSLTVNSTPDVGSTFSLRLPLEAG